ncbi:uncharacterized protein [Eucyclogobius newberryi]|uniref:uncharacterized protein n=1 Tax=Eucyclogobius newberryi TaxID=166745 RepID=UPI003B5A5039
MEVMDHRVNSVPNVSKVVDPDLTWQSLKPVQLINAGSSAAATHPAITEESMPGIVPALIAAGLFITFLIALYTVLWKCMDSKAQPQRKKSKLRVGVRQPDTV